MTKKHDLKKKRTNHRRFPRIKGRRPDLKRQRKAKADANTSYWTSLTPQEQLDNLDQRHLRAKKQRERLGCIQDG